jgi:hypothetical protein
MVDPGGDSTDNDSTDNDGTGDDGSGAEPWDVWPNDILSCGEVHVLGRMPWSSNATFLVVVGKEPPEMQEKGSVPPAEDGAVRAIYKPGKGERPLWDFPGGLYRRGRSL